MQPEDLITHLDAITVPKDSVVILRFNNPISKSELDNLTPYLKEFSKKTNIEFLILDKDIDISVVKKEDLELSWQLYYDMRRLLLYGRR